jgi:hypothetical protein
MVFAGLKVGDGEMVVMLGNQGQLQCSLAAAFQDSSCFLWQGWSCFRVLCSGAAEAPTGFLDPEFCSPSSSSPSSSNYRDSKSSSRSTVGHEWLNTCFCTICSRSNAVRIGGCGSMCLYACGLAVNNLSRG